MRFAPYELRLRKMKNRTVPFSNYIDETVGRRIAKLNGLMLTGTIGILLRAKKEGLSFSMKDATQRMISKGVWLGGGVIDFALYHAGEKGL